MPKTTMRSRRVADLIKNELAFLIRREIRDPRIIHLSITDVVMSPDLRHANVYYTLLEQKDLESVQAGLEKAQGFLRHQLAKHVYLKNTPQIHFIYDNSVIAGEELQRLIDKSVEDKDEDDDVDN